MKVAMSIHRNRNFKLYNNWNNYRLIVMDHKFNEPRAFMIDPGDNITPLYADDNISFHDNYKVITLTGMRIDPKINVNDLLPDARLLYESGRIVQLKLTVYDESSGITFVNLIGRFGAMNLAYNDFYIHDGPHGNLYQLSYEDETK